MSHLATSAPRRYRSPLRERQAEETRARILDATLRVMANGIVSVSIPAVARKAGVSVPTVYRHFGTKGDLLAALYPHLRRRSGLDDLVPPRSIEGLRDGVREVFERIEGIASLDDLARAAMASPAAEEARSLTMPDRIAMARRLADSIEPRLSKADRERIARLLVVLITSSSLRVWLEHLGSSVEEAADDIDWMVRSAVAGTAGRNRR